jgi:tetratricopeptide (TPR) repeat protein
MVAWREVIGWSQDEIDELRAIGYSYLRQGQYKVAQTFFEALVVLDPANLFDLKTLGGLRDIAGDAPGAIDTFTQVLQHAPQDTFALLGLAKAELSAGKQTQAIERLRTLSTSSQKRIALDAQALILAYS